MPSIQCYLFAHVYLNLTNPFSFFFFFFAIPEDKCKKYCKENWHTGKMVPGTWDVHRWDPKTQDLRSQNV